MNDEKSLKEKAWDVLDFIARHRGAELEYWRLVAEMEASDLERLERMFGEDDEWMK